jgi:hypothetical protein
MDTQGIMRRLVPALAALAIAGLAGAGSAWASDGTADRDPAPAPEAGYTVTTFDAGGRVVSVESGTGTEVSGSPEVASLSGCKTLNAWRNGYTLLGMLAWRFHQVKYWCWSYPSITTVSVGAYVSNLLSTYYYRGVVSAHGWFFSWAGSSRGGHYSFRQGQIDNCLLRYGCIRSEYPWVKIWAYGNGGWSYSTGG